MPDVLPAEDATLWWVQSPEAPLWIGAVAIFEAGPLRSPAGTVDIESLRRQVARALDAFPRFRQRLTDLPLGQGLAWVDDARFAVADHVHLAALPAPGGEAELREFVSNLIERPLSSSRPLWDIWVVEGLEGDRVALIPQVNHALADGTALIEFALSMLSFEPHSAGAADVEAPADEQATAEPNEPSSRPSSSPSNLVASVSVGAIERTRHQITALGRLAAAATDPRTIASATSALARGARSGFGRAPALPITRPVGPRRDLAWISLPWDELDQVGRAEGTTLNDVLLTITTGALAHYLNRADGWSEGRRPRLLVPVSAPHPSDQATSNTFSFFLTDLPVATVDPLERLRQIHADTSRHKRTAQLGFTPLLFAIADFVPPAVLRAAAPAILRNQPFANLAVTNMPGSPEPLYLLGARMTEVYPFICGVGNLAVVVGIISYDDRLGVGITVDRDVVPDLDALTDGMRRATDELIAAAAARRDDPPRDDAGTSTADRLRPPRGPAGARPSEGPARRPAGTRGGPDRHRRASGG